MNNLYLKAFAKINIGLKILSKRDDGYHNIETVFQQIDLCDNIKIMLKQDGRIKIRTTNTHVPQNKNNICYQSVILLQQASGKRTGVEIIIEKNIPVGAGLGGGSSDAAAVLRGLVRLWKLEIAESELLSIAGQIGADVPFFLKGGAALATGIGDELAKLDLPTNYYCLLVYPNIEISSTWAYKNINFSLTNTKKSIKLSHIFSNDLDISKLRGAVCNDFEGVVFQEFPELDNIKKILYRNGAHFACMSGSGSTVFGLFKSEKKARDVKIVNFKPYQVFLTKPMTTRNRL